MWRCYRALHRWETAALDGEVSLSQKRQGLLLRLQQVLLLSLQQFPLFLPQPCLNAPGAPEPSPLWLFGSIFRRSSASAGAGASPCSELTYERPPVSPSLLCLPSSAGLELGCFLPCRSPIIGAGGEVGRSRAMRLPGERHLCGGSHSDPAMVTRTWGQGPPALLGCSEEVPPCSGCSSDHFQNCRVLSWLIKGCWAN